MSWILNFLQTKQVCFSFKMSIQRLICCSELACAACYIRKFFKLLFYFDPIALHWFNRTDQLNLIHHLLRFSISHKKPPSEISGVCWPVEVKKNLWFFFFFFADQTKMAKFLIWLISHVKPSSQGLHSWSCFVRIGKTVTGMTRLLMSGSVAWKILGTNWEKFKTGWDYSVPPRKSIKSDINSDIKNNKTSIQIRI